MEEFAQAFFEAFGIEVAFDQSAVADGDDAGFFTDHDDHGIGFLGESECCAMAGSEGAIDVDALADGLLKRECALGNKLKILRANSERFIFGEESRLRQL